MRGFTTTFLGQSRAQITPELAYRSTRYNPITEIDPFNPNHLWGPLAEKHSFRIYGDDRASIWALVDEEDYHWAVQWRWTPKPSRSAWKKYMFRPTHVLGMGNGVRRSIFLHVAIMERKNPNRPSPEHTIADHRNGNSLDCRRGNLRWATPSMNRQNINGYFPKDLIEG